MRTEVFLDTAFALAAALPRDPLHRRAAELKHELIINKTPLVTTRAVLLEIGNSLAKERHRPAAVRLLTAVESDPSVHIVSLTDELYGRALALFQSRLDKEWGLIDCVSFVVMTDRGITDALTSDEHFRQAGFRPLLLEP